MSTIDIHNQPNADARANRDAQDIPAGVLKFHEIFFSDGNDAATLRTRNTRARELRTAGWTVSVSKSRAGWNMFTGHQQGARFHITAHRALEGTMYAGTSDSFELFATIDGADPARTENGSQGQRRDYPRTVHLIPDAQVDAA